MQISESRLYEIILEEISEMGYSAAGGASLRAAQLAGNRDSDKTFLKKTTNDQTEPVSDKVEKRIFAILSDPAKLNEDILTEDVKERIRNLVIKSGDSIEAVKDVAKRLALPVALVMSIWGGAMTGKYLAGGDSVSSGDDIELSQSDDEQKRSDLYGSAYDAEQFHGMSNAEKIDHAWSQYDLERVERAPVSSQFSVFKYAYVPVDQIQPDSVLPLSGMTADTYYNDLVQTVEANPDVELPLLKKMVFGDVGKWSGGVGGTASFEKAADGSDILPPDWTVAHTAYADIMQDKIDSLTDYVADSSPEDRQTIYQQLGVDGDDGFHKFVNDTLFKIGRQTR